MNERDSLFGSSDTIESLTTWPVDSTVFLTLDLECDYGTALRSKHYESASKTGALVEILEDHSVPITCFLQTEVLDESPGSVQNLEEAAVDVEFHAHSHTHPSRSEADVEFEVETSTARIARRFDTNPIGYRFPDGAANSEDYFVLDGHDIPFNASLFPSCRPGRFYNRNAPIFPYRHTASGVVELPFTVYSAHLRIPVALSYAKLLGKPFQSLIQQRPPSTIVFDFHMHDLVATQAYEELPRGYQLIYARNRDSGMEIFETLIEGLKRTGYRFSTINELYRETMEALQ